MCWIDKYLKYAKMPKATEGQGSFLNATLHELQLWEENSPVPQSN